MPIYEYKCEQCGEQIEKLQKISDPPAKTCPACGKDTLKKMVSAAAFKLKGTGWYETDFKNKKPKSGDKTDTDKKSAGDKSDSSKSEKSTETKTDSTKSGNKTASSE
ncbi:MAG: zinc ribbon domain-containing protein [Gammaproteobacteria bacterium]